MPLEPTEVANWRMKARSDWSVARKILATAAPETDAIGFHCQQAVERILKAYLISRLIVFERIHDLGALLDDCSRTDAEFERFRDAVEPLTVFAVAFRYPGVAVPARATVEAALETVQEVWSFVVQRVPAGDVPPTSGSQD
jgi:HEPN domain-containing protein